MSTTKRLSAFLLVAMVAGCGFLPGRDKAESADGPPTVGANAVLSPSFDTTEGKVDAGTAFVVRWTDGKPLLLTAHHLLGEAGGMSREYTGAELNSIVRGVTATSVDDDGVSVTSRSMVDIPDAVSLDQDIRRDMAAFKLESAGQVKVLELADGRPDEGDRIYLLAESDGKLHPAILQARDSSAIYLQYEFEDKVELSGTSGAPMLDASGKVIGIHVGGSDDNTSATGVANSIETFKPVLEKHV